MIDGVIENKVASRLWLALGLASAIWFEIRRIRGFRQIHGTEYAEVRESIKARLMKEAFAVGIGWLICFLVFDAIF